MSKREASFWLVSLSLVAAVNFLAFIISGSPINLVVALLNGWGAADSFATRKGARP